MYQLTLLQRQFSSTIDPDILSTSYDAVRTKFESKHMKQDSGTSLLWFLKTNI